MLKEFHDIMERLVRSGRLDTRLGANVVGTGAQGTIEFGSPGFNGGDEVVLHVMALVGIHPQTGESAG
jgi:hypothetical protein